MSFFDFLHIFTDLFNAAEKAWKKLEHKVQDALIQGSAIIKILGDTVEKAPEEAFELIQKKFPNLDREDLERAINKLAQAINIPNPDLLTTLGNIQTYLLSMSGSGNIFDAIRSSLAQILAIALAPNQTLFAKIQTLIEYVFRKKVK